MKVVKLVIITMALAATFLQLATARSYTVGAPGGSWDYFTNLRKWAASRNFKVGDTLLFEYSEMHNVMEVTKADYDSCKASNPIMKDESGTIVVKLKSAGKRFFICGIEGHCPNGMKMEVDVKNAIPENIITKN
ncbi:hypothetical protein V2J09_001627 [Rumex salicifolius]